MREIFLLDAVGRVPHQFTMRLTFCVDKKRATRVVIANKGYMFGTVAIQVDSLWSFFHEQQSECVWFNNMHPTRFSKGNHYRLDEAVQGLPFTSRLPLRGHYPEWLK